MTLTKAKLVEKVASATHIPKQDALHLVEGFFAEISDILASGEDIKFGNFGSFNILIKKARPGRNPRTGKSVRIKARRVVTFHASQKLKKAIETK